MTLEEVINSEIKKAMLAKEAKRLESLRAVKSAILLMKTDKNTTDGITPEMEISLLQKLVKQRKESADIYRSQNREDLADNELSQAVVIESFLPAQLSEEEVREIVKKVIVNLGATSIKDMGKVMGAASKELAGKAENKVVAGVVKELLTK
ncbi:MAG: GatB/YqeY domain-containing protein [Bacteroidales bacterium]|nr:GatB/YqeY domain-containing protein [Bacteroidales bacterium]